MPEGVMSKGVGSAMGESHDSVRSKLASVTLQDEAADKVKVTLGAATALQQAIVCSS